ncbi:hypothetical protein QZH41_005582 [Actinostola sp. cb2023]|nr:hypothetical protein QZH41_005582 [Actinostola sp. cb2023]
MQKDSLLAEVSLILPWERAEERSLSSARSQGRIRETSASREAERDADLLIVKIAVESTQTKTTILIGDDTDLLILLLFYIDPDGYDLFFIPEPKTNSLRRRVWNIKSIQAQLGKEVCRNILFIHAVLGCDTTSRTHGIGKGSALKKFITSAHFREQVQMFNGIATKEAIETAGHNALVIFYNGKPGSQLNDIRYQRYKEKLATRTTHIQHNNLPPTSAAAKYNSYRVYAQILQ